MKNYSRPYLLNPPYEVRTDPDTGERWEVRFSSVKCDSEGRVDTEDCERRGLDPGIFDAH